MSSDIDRDQRRFAWKNALTEGLHSRKQCRYAGIDVELGHDLVREPDPEKFAEPCAGAPVIESE